jgi:ArsR family transcriptional regulator, arsenate/arsenite/antimonite-responsive transcriptional repressor / arsenate reductase (thioredoxin)
VRGVGHRRLVADPGAPAFLILAGHPLRWRLLGELSRSDRRVQELVALVAQPQNLVSYHLGRLRRAKLVTTRRSAADGRDTYYSVDLARCGSLLSTAGGALHPGLRLAPPALAGPRAGRAAARVLFLCTGNSSRSQMAEALLRHRAGDAVAVCSAGSAPKPVHPHALTVMAERGIDLAGHRSKHLDMFIRRRFDYVITLCDRVREVCPEFPGDARPVHWSIPDPAAQPDGYPAFQRTATELADRIRFLMFRLWPVSTVEDPSGKPVDVFQPAGA